MRLTTTGGANTSVGQCSMYTNTTGNSIASFGNESLFSNTTGASNTALGFRSLRSNTTASNNTAVGTCSLYANTTGDRNVAIGRSALQNNTTASSNTAVGYQSLNDNTTGTLNTAVGQCALYNNETGFENTAIGRATLFNNTGNCNVGLGESAGYNITTGNNNLLLGNDAGRENSPSGTITTQSNIAVYGNNSITNHYMAGDLRLTTGGLYVGGSADANKLDDYEEGTWTPTLNASDTGTLSDNAGYYIKIGSMVFINCVGTKSGGSLNEIEGLPFTVLDYGANYNNSAINGRKGNSKVITKADTNVLGMLVESTGVNDNSASFGFSLTYYTDA